LSPRALLGAPAGGALIARAQARGRTNAHAEAAALAGAVMLLGAAVLLAARFAVDRRPWAKV